MIVSQARRVVKRLSGLALWLVLGSTVWASPQIDFDQELHDLGKVNEGVELSHQFKVSNKGDAPLILKSATSTCGCTIPKIKQKIIEPGATALLEVTLDTSMKQGKVKKEIDVVSNDPAKPVAIIYLAADVRSPHADLDDDKKAKIFSGRCAACHVERGKGKLGQELFFADCAICHGYRAQGIPGVAPKLVPGSFENPDFYEAIKEIICFGSKKHRSMPGFLDRAGGPLSEREIDSLMDFLNKKNDLLKKESKLP